MGKKKPKDAYNDFLDGEKLKDNAGIRTTLQGPSTSTAATRDVSPPPTRSEKGGKGKGKSGNGKGPKRPQLTHFLCLPLVNEGSRAQLETSLGEFKGGLRPGGKWEGLVSERAVRPVGTIHLTLGVMSLDEEGLQAAGKILEEMDVKALLSGEGLFVDVKALVPMQQPRKTSILYAEPKDRTGRLYGFAEALRDRFMQEGVLVEDKRALKLHATVVNTIYAKPRGRGGRDWKEKHRGGRRQVVEGPAEGSGHNEDTSIAGSVEVETDLNEATATSAKSEEDGEESREIDRSEGHGPNAKSWMRFDASELIEQYRDVKWAENVKIDRVQICKMGAKKILDHHGDIEDEKYEVVFEKII